MLGGEHEWGSRLKGIAGRTIRRPLVETRHRGVRPPDVLVAAYPKSGGTWLRFQLTRALTGEDVDFDRVRELSPPVEDLRAGRAILPGNGRLVKSHDLPVSALLRRGVPVVYLVRDGRDVCVSSYYHLRRRGRLPERFLDDSDLNDFARWFLLDGVGWYGRWQRHVEAWLRERDRQPTQVYVLRYEDMLAAPDAALRDVCTRFGWPVRDGAIESAVSASSPDSMRRAEAVSHRTTDVADSSVPFVRAARSGSWREELSDTMAAAFVERAGGALRRAGYEF